MCFAILIRAVYLSSLAPQVTLATVNFWMMKLGVVAPYLRHCIMLNGPEKSSMGQLLRERSTERSTECSIECSRMLAEWILRSSLVLAMPWKTLKVS